MKYIFYTQTTTDGRKIHYLADENKQGTGDVEIIEEGLSDPIKRFLELEEEISKEDEANFYKKVFETNLLT